MYARRTLLIGYLLLFSLVFGACSKSLDETIIANEPTLPVESPTVPPSPTSSPSPAEPTPTATELPAREIHPVIVISWDGAPAQLVNDLMDSGYLPTFKALADAGLRAEYAIPVNPSLTAPSQNSISSGSLPRRTGIVSNAYHNSNDSFYWYRQGFDEVMDDAEPVWVTASRAGLTTAALFFVGGSTDHPGQTADYTISYGVRDAYSRQETLPLTPEEGWVEIPASFSPPLETGYQISRVARLNILVLDTTDDGTQNYDRVLFDINRNPGDGALQLSVGEWGSLVILPPTFAGADILVQELNEQEITFYHTGVYHNTAAPRNLLEALNLNFGFYPAGADSYALEHGWITYEDYLYLMERASTWMAEVAAWVYTTYQPDLLFTWQNPFDASGHAFYLKDPRQSGYTPEEAVVHQAYYRQAAMISDQALRLILDAVDTDSATVMLVSDHGMTPIHTEVFVNTLLEQAGLLTLDDRNYLVVEESQTFAVASGGAVNIYINLVGRETDGIVTSDEYPQIRDQVMDLFATLSDPNTGELIFQRVLAHEELDQLDLDHPNSGDVFAQAFPGYNLNGWRGWSTVFDTPRYYGQHGYDSELPEMQGIFLAAGIGIPDTGGVLQPVSVLDYAPTIAGLLGFEPAATVDGVAIEGIVYPGQ